MTNIQNACVLLIRELYKTEPVGGGKARLIKGDVCWVKCDYCGAETAAETSTTEAIAAWNRRVNDGK